MNGMNGTSYDGNFRRSAAGSASTFVPLSDDLGLRNQPAERWLQQSAAAAFGGGHVRCVRAGRARAMHADAQRAQATEHVRNGPPADRC